MGFLQKVEALKVVDDKIAIDEIYSNDPEFKNFLERVSTLLRHFSVKFQADEDILYNVLVNKVKDRL